MGRTSDNQTNRPRVSLGWLAACVVVVLALLAGACSNSPLDVTGPSTTAPEPAPTTTTGLPPTSGPSTTTQAPPTTTEAPDPGAVERLVTQVESVDQFFKIARTGPTGTSTLKFVMPDFTASDEVQWLNANFYELHDEWYWFQVLNGIKPPGATARPLRGESFATIAEAKQWASANPDKLPEDVSIINSRVTGNRVYSTNFYALANDTEPRQYGVGGIVYFPANEVTDERWLLELGFGDDITDDELEVFFDRLTASLPNDIADRLEWVVRSPAQAQTAEVMTAADHPLSSRIVHYRDLVPEGEVAVYNEGITAGRLILIEEGGGRLEDARDIDILLVDNVPDYLPPANALISSGPQTPLAHVNLLAKNRGIPNASMAGVLNNDEIRQAARVRSYAIVRAVRTADGDQLDIKLITEEQYLEWVDLTAKQKVSVELPADDVDPVIDLSELATQATDRATRDAWVPTIGGKAVGFISLLQSDVRTPDRPVAIPIGLYRAHFAKARAALNPILRIENFDVARNGRMRYLVFEGPSDYAEFYTTPEDQKFAVDFAKAVENTLVADVLEAGGFKQYFRNIPLDVDTLEAITEGLEANFDHLDPQQGLRFRSSSSAEDIEGFSGAGLYDSNTGFFNPEDQPNAKDHKKTVEYTIKKTWASYWSFEAYEERRRERIDHVTGGMGIVVHPRFDDELERNNGVVTVTLTPNLVNGVVQSYASAVEINVQAGAMSVTNPDPTSADLPEVVRVTIDGDEETIDRISASTIAEAEVLSNDQVLQLARQTTIVATAWLTSTNEDLPAEQHRRSLTLDFEFKTMDESWPATRQPATYDTPLVIKQVRSLDRGLRGLPTEITDLPVPRDVLAAAVLVQQRTCQDPEQTTFIQVFTDPLVDPDLGYSDEPFKAYITRLVNSSPEPADPADTQYECPRKLLYSSPGQFLVQLLNQNS